MNILERKKIENLYIFSVSWFSCKMMREEMIVAVGWDEVVEFSANFFSFLNDWLFHQFDGKEMSVFMFIGLATLTWIACYKVDKIDDLEHFFFGFDS